MILEYFRVGPQSWDFQKTLPRSKMFQKLFLEPELDPTHVHQSMQT